MTFRPRGGSALHRIRSAPHTVAVTGKNVAGIEVRSALKLLFCLPKRALSSPSSSSAGAPVGAPVFYGH